MNYFVSFSLMTRMFLSISMHEYVCAILSHWAKLIRHAGWKCESTTCDEFIVSRPITIGFFGFFNVFPLLFFFCLNKVFEYLFFNVRVSEDLANDDDFTCYEFCCCCFFLNKFFNWTEAIRKRNINCVSVCVCVCFV